MFKKIHAKLGNMRKSVEWVIYPQSKDSEAIIQCDKRICRVNLLNGKGCLPDAKHGNYFPSLAFGVEIDIPGDVLNQLRNLATKEQVKL